MALVIVVLLIAGGFAAGMAVQQGWLAYNPAIVALRGIGFPLILLALLAIYTWWRLHRMRKETYNEYEE